MLKPSFNLKHLLKRKYQAGPLPLVQEQLAKWFDDSYGESLHQEQKARCEKVLARHFGYRVAQLGVSPRHSLLENLQPPHKSVLSRSSDSASCQCEFEALPLPSGTIDIVIVHHVLDFSPHPHQALIEAARVVTEGGYIVVIGFNPLSLFGLCKWPGAWWSRQPVWQHNSLRKARVIDWLQLLGFQVSEASGTESSVLNFKPQRWKKRFGRQGLIRDSFYLLLAHKAVAPLTPARTKHWSPIRLGALGNFKPVQNTDTGKGSGETISESS